MDSNEMLYAKGVLIRLAQAARGDRELARAVRDLVKESGILHVFSVDEEPNLFELLEAGGVELLRTQLGELSLAQLKQIVTDHQYDPEKASARWRSTGRFVDLIVARAQAQWERVVHDQRLHQVQPEPQPELEVVTGEDVTRPKVLSGVSWML
ncbi:MAG: hypothetical protein PVSMB4_03330 [Ktedonobacterales bacterium]